MYKNAELSEIIKVGTLLAQTAKIGTKEQKEAFEAEYGAFEDVAKELKVCGFVFL